MARIPAFLSSGVLLLMAVTCWSAAPASNQLPSYPGPPGMGAGPEARKSDGQIWVEGQLDLQGRRAQFVREYFLHEKKDVDRILSLATEFRDYGEHAQDPALTPGMLKKIHKLEDLTHDLRKLMYAGSAPRIKKSETDLFVGAQAASSEGANEPDRRLRQASNLGFELASRLSDATYHYLGQANQNTFSIASLATAKDVVNIAAKLEGLAHEVQQAYRLPPQAK